MISDRKDRVSNKFYSWIFMIAGLRFPPIYDIFVFGFLHLKYIQKVGARNYGKKRSEFRFIHDLLVEAGIQADTQGSNIVPINDALKTASKHQTGKAGFPEYTAVVDDFVLVMEDKADRANLCLKDADGTISMTVQATTDYAVNGALHYAQHILQKTTYKKVFAFGNAGDSKHHTLQPLFVDKNG